MIKYCKVFSTWVFVYYAKLQNTNMTMLLHVTNLVTKIKSLLLYNLKKYAFYYKEVVKNFKFEFYLNKTSNKLKIIFGLTDILTKLYPN